MPVMYAMSQSATPQMRRGVDGGVGRTFITIVSKAGARSYYVGTDLLNVPSGTNYVLLASSLLTSRHSRDP
jgi:hypothetical protein